MKGRRRSCGDWGKEGRERRKEKKGKRKKEIVNEQITIFDDAQTDKLLIETWLFFPQKPCLGGSLGEISNTHDVDLPLPEQENHCFRKCQESFEITPMKAKEDEMIGFVYFGVKQVMHVSFT